MSPWVRKEELAEGVVLYQGDMLEVLPALGEFDACVTDPPYGIGEHGGRVRTRLKGRAAADLLRHECLGWDNESPPAEAFSLILTKSSHQIIWGGNYFADKLPVSKGWLYWQKLMGGDFSDGELAWSNRDRALREYTCCPKGKGGDHPTQKPVEVMTWCLDLLPADVRSVCDPFCGSGTTGVACVKRGMSFTGIEREPAYFDVACRRISDALKAPDLFIAPPPAPMKQESLL